MWTPHNSSKASTNANWGHRQTSHRPNFKRTHDLRPFTTSDLDKSSDRSKLTTIPSRFHMSSFASVDSILVIIVAVKIDFSSNSRDNLFPVHHPSWSSFETFTLLTDKQRAEFFAHDCYHAFTEVSLPLECARSLVHRPAVSSYLNNPYYGQPSFDIEVLNTYPVET